MNLTSQQYADLADHSYDRDGNMAQLARAREVVEINGSRYKVLEFADNTKTGYQGTIYQHVDSGAIVVAHRGTEFGREAFRDGVVADGGMVFNRANSQADNAIALTRRARELARDPMVSDQYGGVLEVTVTGHSLGGTLAQVSAHHFDLRGETFNAYGAASLDRRIPEGGNRVLNHVMAVDAVSSASPHYGQVRVYASSQEITTLRRAGYHDNFVLDALRPNLPVTASVISGGSHSMHNFLPVDGDGRIDRSALADPAMRERAEEHRRMIGAYREEVETLRRGITATSRGPVGAVLDGIDRLRGTVPAGEPAAREERERAEREARQSRASSGRQPASWTPLSERYPDLYGDPDVFKRLTGVESADPAFRPPLRAPTEPQASRAHLAPLQHPAAEVKSGAYVDQLLQAARNNNPEALREATRELQQSAFGQAWQQQVAGHRRSLEQVAETPDIEQSGQRQTRPAEQIR